MSMSVTYLIYFYILVLLLLLSQGIRMLFWFSLGVSCAGPRICLGKDFAYRQMKIVSIALLHFFVFKLADESRKVTYRTMFTLHIDGGLHLLATPRSSW
ncbi:putative abieta-7,13-dien-18-ol hydroxylase [Helianthus anomalus]